MRYLESSYWKPLFNCRLSSWNELLF